MILEQPEGMRQIIAMGGGGFWMEPENPLLDQYLIEASPVENPTVCFLPTACGDSHERIELFYRAFNSLPCRPIHLSLYRQVAEREKIIRESDIIYVGGGNTRFMLAIWKSCGMDKLLQEAWESGKVLCGLSAGAICWFEEGLTDSNGPLEPLKCLGFLKGSCAPHYDGEANRRPDYHRYLKSGEIQSGIALDDGAAAHYIDQDLQEFVSSRPTAKAHSVSFNNGEVTETVLPTRYLG